MRMSLALARAGFRRYATYRQSTLAATVTNTVFGCLRVYVLLAVAGGTSVAGYDSEHLSTYTWVTQGMIGVVLLWGWSELADKVRTGDVTGDLLRPVNPLWVYLATDLGRAAHACCIRLLTPVAVGAIFFPFYWPRVPYTYLCFLGSVVAAVVVCFSIRYMMNLTAFWLLDIRGVTAMWTLLSGVATGLFFPLDFLPAPLAFTTQYLTPFASIIQFPADILAERGGIAGQLTRLSIQVLWATLCLVGAWFIQIRATRKLVIQGG